jgi:UDP-N-acetylmuramate dehydrogenase
MTTSFLADLNIRTETDVPLGPRTWYGVGGHAACLAHPSSIAQLSALVAACREHATPLYVLGAGANLLVREGEVPGVVVTLDDPSFAQLKIDGQLVTAGAGYDLFKLVRETAKAGLGSLEVVAGIPASVGGAVRMNAGGAYGEIGSAVKRVQVMSGSGQVYYRDRDDLVFSYRHVNIEAPFILEVEFELTAGEPGDLMNRVKEIFLYKKNSQPLGDASAGCAFKNPQPTEQDAHPTPAGKLIDRCGLKGYRHGSAYVSEIHANFVGVDAGGQAEDVWEVIQHVEQTVREMTGVSLEREVVVWP